MQEEEPHFRLTVLGMLQLSKYLRWETAGGSACRSRRDDRRNTEVSGIGDAHLMMLSRQLICW